MRRRIITRNIWILSLVSFFTDMASEMLYPVMPLFLEQIGYTAVFIGVLEGAAEAVAGLSKSYFGKWSDEKGKRLPFVQMGYALSAISKPMLAFVFTPAWIFCSRTLDRLGKGIRTGARDALLSDEATPTTKAAVFGFHRSLDTLGAVAGPLIALAYLAYHPGNYTSLFLVAFLPGVAAIACTLIIKEKRQHAPAKEKKLVSFFAFIAYFKNSSASYKKLVLALLLFALVNSSDVFLILKMKAAGLNDTVVISMYIFYNIIYALVAYPIGILADKKGLKKMMMFGLLVFAVVYAGFALADSFWMFGVLLFLYGIYAAATEGIAKAWISNIAHRSETATAIATYSGFQSIAALLASSVAGLTWFALGSQVLFAFAAIITLAVIIFLRFTPIAEAHEG